MKKLNVQELKNYIELRKEEIYRDGSKYYEELSKNNSIKKASEIRDNINHLFSFYDSEEIEKFAPDLANIKDKRILNEKIEEKIKIGLKEIEIQKENNLKNYKAIINNNISNFIEKIKYYNLEQLQEFCLKKREEKFTNSNVFHNAVLKSIYLIYDFGLDYVVLQKNKNKTIIKGFKSGLTEPQIETLYNLLTDKNYIAKNTDLASFKAMFKEEPLPESYFIKWNSTNVLLAYFVKKIFQNDNFTNFWSKSELIFNIKNLRQSETNNPNPKNFEKIDNIISQL